MTIKFVKMHGLGNDFAIFDARRVPVSLPAGRILALADRHRGIGFDQMAIMDPPRTSGTATYFRIYNADGTEVAACGNVTRCIGKLLMKELGKSALALETVAGVLNVWRAEGAIGVDMGPPRLDWQDMPLARAQDTLSLDISVKSLANPVAVSMGNPHAVFFVPDAESVPLDILGPEIENHPLFPERVNVEVATVQAPDKIRMRVWERGTGLTQACGTGACATLVAAVRRGLVPGRKAAVVLDGGTLDIEWRESDGHVLMLGDAVAVYHGVLA